MGSAVGSPADGLRQDRHDEPLRALPFARVARLLVFVEARTLQPPPRPPEPSGGLALPVGVAPSHLGVPSTASARRRPTQVFATSVAGATARRTLRARPRTA